MTRCRPVLLAVFAFAVLVATPTAQAHFKLDSPPAYSTQSSLGDPQKSPPCGPGGSFTPTNLVTAVQTGSTFTIQITETIFHPGHYRVAIAQDENGLPADPVVTPSGGDPCAVAAIEPNPTLPLLADGLLDHTTAFSGPQTMQVTLPAGFTCTNCLLQVIQTMSKHGAPCFYHHCATMTVADDAPPPPDGVIPGDDGGIGGGGEATGGCCDAGGSSPASGLAGALLVGLLVLRRRR